MSETLCDLLSYACIVVGGLALIALFQFISVESLQVNLLYRGF